ncbi:trimeric intracellular cation channel family protein [Flavobacterium sp. NRK F7]|uniref:trimeric intracellular cation channel family protein n=1 Tax=Flavobacterium sp. NRK F7 TaxID=2954930 RepID=UPI0020916176|nr:trimeric intracellular cation channel family protein [Flavobacterium sp. NRK F7]MCO6163733.1 trimeric intracellular cation channel family protein [Flavobacterium sp. NRK F7]
MVEYIDSIGTLVFAISGALTAIYKKLDLFGVFCIAFVTALGGGTLRDVLIGNTPVGWMLDLKYIIIIFSGSVLSILFNAYLEKLRISLFLFDTIGFGVFTLIGIEKGIEKELHPVICIALGTLTATFGGVIRDILCNEIPVLFRKEIYATLSILGGVLFFLLLNCKLEVDLIYLLSSFFIIVARILCFKMNWSLPTGSVFVKK